MSFKHSASNLRLGTAATTSDVFASSSKKKVPKKGKIDITNKKSENNDVGDERVNGLISETRDKVKRLQTYADKLKRRVA